MAPTDRFEVEMLSELGHNLQATMKMLCYAAVVRFAQAFRITSSAERSVDSVQSGLVGFVCWMLADLNYSRSDQIHTPKGPRGY